MTTVHPLLLRAFDALRRADVAWCLLRGRESLDRPPGDVDLLVSASDRTTARRALEGAGFVSLRSWAGGTQNFFLNYDEATDLWVYLHVVTELDFGSRHSLRLRGAAAAALARRVTTDGIPELESADSFWVTLLHAVLDKGVLAPKHRRALSGLVTGAPEASPLAECLRRHLAGLPRALALGGAEEIVRAVRAEHWDAVAELRAPLSASWRRVDHAAPWRRLRNGASLLVRKASEALTRRGVDAAVLAPDGAGKSTVIEALLECLFFRVRPYYLGLEGGRFAGAGRSRVPGSGLALRALYAWSTWLRARVDLSRRRIVVYDRYPYEALVPPLNPRNSTAIRRRLLGSLLPRPSVVVLLDAPGSVLAARKAEHPPERLEHDRRAYLDLARRRRWVVVDATRDPTAVRRDVTAVIWRAYQARHGTTRHG